jgi:hypothetical protein
MEAAQPRRPHCNSLRSESLEFRTFPASLSLFSEGNWVAECQCIAGRPQEKVGPCPCDCLSAWGNPVAAILTSRVLWKNPFQPAWGWALFCRLCNTLTAVHEGKQERTKGHLQPLTGHFITGNKIAADKEISTLRSECGCSPCQYRHIQCSEIRACEVHYKIASY